MTSKASYSLLTIFTFALFILPFYSERGKDLKGVNGKIIINNNDLEYVLALNGEWRFYPLQMLTPKMIKMETNYELMSVPGSWEVPDGYNTYQLDLEVPKEDQIYGIYLNRVESAYKLWINGDLKIEVGEVGKEKNNYTPMRKTMYTSFLANGKIQIVLQVANFDHLRGGISHAILFGTDKKISVFAKYLNQIDVFSTAILILIGIFWLNFYMALKTREYLWDSMAFIFSGIHVAFIGENIAVDLFSMPWWLYMKVAHITFPLVAVCYTNALSSYYPREKIAKLGLAFNTAFLAYALLVAVSPAKIYIQVLIFVHILLLTNALYWCYIVIRAYQNKRPLAVFNLAILSWLFIALVQTILYINQYTKSYKSMSVALTMVGLMHMRLLSHRFLKLTHSHDRAVMEVRKKEVIVKKTEKVIKKQEKELEQAEETVKTAKIEAHQHKIEKSKVERQVRKLAAKSESPKVLAEIIELTPLIPKIGYFQKEVNTSNCHYFSPSGEELGRSSLSLNTIATCFEDKIVRTAKNTCINLDHLNYGNSVIREGGKDYLVLSTAVLVPLGPSYKARIFSSILN